MYLLGDREPKTQNIYLMYDSLHPMFENDHHSFFHSTQNGAKIPMVSTVHMGMMSWENNGKKTTCFEWLYWPNIEFLSHSLWF